MYVDVLDGPKTEEALLEGFRQKTPVRFRWGGVDRDLTIASLRRGDGASYAIDATENYDGRHVSLTWDVGSQLGNTEMT